MTSLTVLPSLGGGSCSVHPVVLFTICDAYTRRAAGAQRVIGTLLGSVSASGAVDVRTCYTVPHSETNEQVGPRGGRGRAAGASRLRRAYVEAEWSSS